jgi:hypothetical protein
MRAYGIPHRRFGVHTLPTIVVHFSAAPPRGARSAPRRPYPGALCRPGLCARLRGLCARGQSLDVVAGSYRRLLVEEIRNLLRLWL